MFNSKNDNNLNVRVKPGRFLWQMGESIQNVELKKQYYLASFEYLKKAKRDIRKLIDEDTISPLSWNHTSYYRYYRTTQVDKNARRIS